MTADSLTLLGTAVTIIGTIVTLWQAREAVKARKGAQQFFDALSSLRTAMTYARLVEIADRARIDAGKLQRISAGVRGTNIREDIQRLEDHIHNLRLHPEALRTTLCEGRLAAVSRKITDLKSATVTLEEKANLAASIRDDICEVHVALNKEKHRLEFPAPAS